MSRDRFILLYIKRVDRGEIKLRVVRVVRVDWRTRAEADLEVVVEEEDAVEVAGVGLVVEVVVAEMEVEDVAMGLEGEGRW